MKSLTMTWLLNIAARRPIWQLLFLPIKHVLKKEINYIFGLIIFFIFFFTLFYFSTFQPKINNISHLMRTFFMFRAAVVHVEKPSVQLTRGANIG